jgi:GNAT-like C-terminal domain
MTDRAELKPFLDPALIQRSCAVASLSAEATQGFLDFAARVNADATLLAHASAAHWCLYETQDDCTPVIRQAEAAFGDDAKALRALMVLDSIRLIREKQTARTVPYEIMRAVLEHHPCATLRDYIAQNGHIGADAWIWSWYRTVGSGHLYGLGRLEFFHETWDYPWRAFGNDATGDLIVLLNAGLCFADDCYMSGELTWATTLQDTDTAIIGHPVLPDGRAGRIPICLERAEWRQVLGPGDIVLDMHVPGERPLTLDLIHDAMHQAESFFDHYYPGQSAKAFVCDSWLFSPELKRMLPPDSNILRWQREGYLLPNDSDGSDFLTFVFGASSIDPATAPRDTRLRRAVIGHLEQSGSLHCGGYLLMRKDLPRFGSQPYGVTSEQAIARLSIHPGD